MIDFSRLIQTFFDKEGGFMFTKGVTHKITFQTGVDKTIFEFVYGKNGRGNVRREFNGQPVLNYNICFDAKNVVKL